MRSPEGARVNPFLETKIKEEKQQMAETVQSIMSQAESPKQEDFGPFEYGTKARKTFVEGDSWQDVARAGKPSFEGLTAEEIDATLGKNIEEITSPAITAKSGEVTSINPSIDDQLKRLKSEADALIAARKNISKPAKTGTDNK